ncbi:hypothetical protein G5V58_07530 [Nocardioides anomalus]|uniref:YfhO family protein n=1 Tax=Nocardioides anomalus TaxID=2712223 RepID=A0A6G6WBE1_9ACTN|nr:hypothetical protein [Nocardioides anomalus]QIG42648.1 hypothetical protein G5V58_07530 [Nocardioides anomalus]
MSDAPAPPGATRGRRRPSRLVVAGLALVVAQLVFRAWALHGSWFYFDDLAFMSRAMNQPLDAHYLLESYGGHLMPGGFLVAYGLTEVAAFSWGWWAALLLLMQAVAGVGMLRLLLSMFGPRPFVLVLLAGYLSYVFTLSAGIWFAAGINQLPMQIALTFGLHAHLAYLRHRRVRSLVTCLLWTAFGLVFYEKTLLLFGVYALVTLGWFSHGRTPERLRHVWDTYRPAVIAYAAVGAAYLAAYVEWGLDFSPGDSNAQPWSPIALNLVGLAFSTGVIGGPFRWEPLAVGSFADPSQIAMALSWAAVLGVAIYAYRTRTRTKRAWSLLGFTLFCDVVLLASARANIVGPDIAREYRYQTESAALFVLGLGLAFLPLVGATENGGLREGVPLTYERPRFVALVALAVVAAATYSSVRYVDLWQDRNHTRSYFDTVEQQLRATDAATGTRVPLVDVGIPQTLLWAYRYPENTYSHLFRPLSRWTSYPDQAVDDLYLFDDTGELTPVDVPPTRSARETTGCGYRLDDEQTSVPLDGPVFGDGWWIRVDYEADAPTPVTVTAGDLSHDLDLPAGEHTLFVTGEGEFRSVSFAGYDADAEVCIGSLRLGLPEAGQ